MERVEESRKTDPGESSEVNSKHVVLTERDLGSLIFKNKNMNRSLSDRGNFSFNLNRLTFMCPDFTVSTDQQGVVFQFPNPTKLESALKQMCKGNSSTLKQIQNLPQRFRVIKDGSVFIIKCYCYLERNESDISRFIRKNKGVILTSNNLGFFDKKSAFIFCAEFRHYGAKFTESCIQDLKSVIPGLSSSQQVTDTKNVPKVYEKSASTGSALQSNSRSLNPSTVSNCVYSNEIGNTTALMFNSTHMSHASISVTSEVPLVFNNHDITGQELGNSANSTSIQIVAEVDLKTGGTILQDNTKASENLYLVDQEELKLVSIHNDCVQERTGFLFHPNSICFLYPVEIDVRDTPSHNEVPLHVLSTFGPVLRVTKTWNGFLRVWYSDRYEANRTVRLLKDKHEIRQLRIEDVCAQEKQIEDEDGELMILFSSTQKKDISSEFPSSRVYKDAKGWVLLFEDPSLLFQAFYSLLRDKQYEDVDIQQLSSLCPELRQDGLGLYTLEIQPGSFTQIQVLHDAMKEGELVSFQNSFQDRRKFTTNTKMFIQYETKKEALRTLLYMRSKYTITSSLSVPDNNLELVYRPGVVDSKHISKHFKCFACRMHEEDPGQLRIMFKDKNILRKVYKIHSFDSNLSLPPPPQQQKQQE